MLPDTVFQKPLKPIDKPLPVRGLNTVHNTSFRDAIMDVASKGAGMAAAEFVD